MKIVPLLLATLFCSTPALAEDETQSAFAAQIAAEPQSDDDTRNNLAFYALSLSGTPYKYGGNSPDNGFDCSGFVGHVFRQSLGVCLPRSAREISHIGKEIDTARLRPGDLVFYNTMQRTFSHVGIYLGDDRFVHSPSSGGSIRVDDMRDDYWRQRYNGARRINLKR